MWFGVFFFQSFFYQICIVSVSGDSLRFTLKICQIDAVWLVNCTNFQNLIFGGFFNVWSNCGPLLQTSKRSAHDASRRVVFRWFSAHFEEKRRVPGYVCFVFKWGCMAGSRQESQAAALLQTSKRSVHDASRRVLFSAHFIEKRGCEDMYNGINLQI